MQLCDAADVAKYLREPTNTRESTHYADAIDYATQKIVGKYRWPLHRSYFVLDSAVPTLQYEYWPSEEETYRVDQVVIRDNNNTRVVFTVSASASHSSLTVTKNATQNTITFHTDTVTAYSGNICEVDIVFKLFHKLAVAYAAWDLISRDETLVARDTRSTKIDRIREDIAEIIESIERFDRASAVGSEESRNYDIRDGLLVIQKRFKTF